MRASDVVETEQQLIDVHTAIMEGSTKPTDPAPEGDPLELLLYRVVRFKNRFQKPLFNGYRDALYNIAVYIGNHTWVVCEVRLSRWELAERGRVGGEQSVTQSFLAQLEWRGTG